MGEAKLTASPFMYLSNLTQQFSIERASMGFTNSAEICKWKPFTSQVCDTIENIWIVKLHKQNVKKKSLLSAFINLNYTAKDNCQTN